MEMLEIDRYYDKESINNWSVREYKYKGLFISGTVILERNNSLLNPSFRAFVHVGHPKHTGAVKIQNSCDFGEGFSWNLAESLLKNYLESKDTRIK